MRPAWLALDARHWDSDARSVDLYVRVDESDLRVLASHANPQPISFALELEIYHEFAKLGINVWDGRHRVEYDTLAQQCTAHRLALDRGIIGPIELSQNPSG
jgi:hypothetical protein